MLLDRYLARKVAIVLSVTAPSFCLLVALLQAMRLLPLVISADLDIADVAGFLATIIIPLSAVVVPAAAVLTLMMVLSRLEGDGELMALRASGASSTRLAMAPAMVCAVVVLGAGLVTLIAEPFAYRSIEERLGELLVRASLGRVRPGVIAEPVPGLTVVAERREGDILENVMIEDRRSTPSSLLLSRRATFMPSPGEPSLRIVLEEGTVQSRSSAGMLTRATFSRLELTLELESSDLGLGALVPRRFGLDLPSLWREASLEGPSGREAAQLLHRRLAVAPGAFGLCLIALFLALTRPIATRTWAIVIGAGLILAFHLLSRFGEALVEASVLSPVSGGWLPAIFCWASLCIAVSLRRARWFIV